MTGDSTEYARASQAIRAGTRVGRAAVSRGPVIVSGIAVLVTLALVPLGTHRLSPAASFVPAVLSVVACFDLLSMYLLMGDYRDNGDLRILAMCGAYLWSLILMAGYALAFPGVVSVDPPLAITPSVAPWLYVGWHAGFPILLGAAWAPWPRDLAATSPGRRRAVARAAMTVVAGAAVVAVAATGVFARQLPVLIHGRDTLRMAEVTGPVVLPLVAAALFVSWRGTRRRSGPEVWTAVAVLACLCDLVLTYSSRYRFSLGWYAGRAMTVTAAAMVLFAMLVGFRQLKSRAEYDASYDSLTGLANRRRTLDALGEALAAARHSRTALGVVLLDLDYFKQVNDRYGHAVGDELLRAVGGALAGAVRARDVVGRVGGEEFLAILPGADGEGARLVAERMREAVAALDMPLAGRRSTASVGVACLGADDHDVATLLRRADEMLCRAKDSGRNRVVVAGPASVSEDIAGALTRRATDFAGAAATSPNAATGPARTSGLIAAPDLVGTSGLVTASS